MADVKKSVNEQMRKAMQELLIPFQPELQDRTDAEKIVAYFSGNRLVACVDCLLKSGRTIESISKLINRRKKSTKLARRKREG